MYSIYKKVLFTASAYKTSIWNRILTYNALIIK
jgi:hypothetical protein